MGWGSLYELSDKVAFKLQLDHTFCKNLGAIALVEAADVKSGMKVLKIGGHMPAGEHYPLH